MVRQMIASVAVAAAVLAMQSTGVDAATARKPGAAQHHAMHGKPAHAKMMAKHSARGGAMNRVADRLNGCQLRPEGERKACMDQVTR